MIRSLFLIGVLLGASCRKPETSTGTPEPTRLPMPSAPTNSDNDRQRVEMERALDKQYGDKRLEKEAMRAAIATLDAQLDAEEKIAEANRRMMIDPPAADFKPEPVARKVELRLALEKTEIRVNEAPRFRLELTNVGREAIDYQETRSSLFVRGGNLITTKTMRFYLTDSRGGRTELVPVSIPRAKLRKSDSKTIGPSEGLTASERENWLLQTNAMGTAHATFKVRILPGETLHSLGDSAPHFKPISTDFDFNKPGSYWIHVELDDRPQPLTQRYIDISLKTGDSLDEIKRLYEKRTREALGPVSSNSVSFEVVK